MLQQLFITVKVFSAHAEVVPEFHVDKIPGAGILRARGGSSHIVTYQSSTGPYSPRTRR